MQIIAHRIFRDTDPIEPLAFDGRLQLSGVELDIRASADGEPMVDHAPIFLLRRRRLAQIPKSLRAAIHFLAREFPELDLLMLDIKSMRAAEAVVRLLPDLALPFRLIFNCWHRTEVRILRAAFPAAEIHFCLAPIVSNRLSRTRFRDLYLCNAFPFIHAHRRFTPLGDKVNAHSVNIRMIAPDRLPLPGGVDGICVHRLFCTPELIGTVRRSDLRLSVFGLRAGRRRLAHLAPLIDYAIVGSLGRGRPDTPSNSLRSAM